MRAEVWGFYAEGLMRLVDPAAFSGFLNLFLREDADFTARDCHVTAMSAFGTLVGWSERHQRFELDPVNGTLSCRGQRAPEEKTKPDLSIFVAIAPVDYTGSFDLYDDADDKPMFEHARKTLGPLGPDEIYGLKLAPALGGARELANLKRVKAIEHLAILAQLEPLKLMDFSAFPARVIRTTG